MAEAAKSECIFEVNTGAVSKGFRTSPYPAENLLRVLKKADAKLILSSDSHDISTIDFGFSELQKYIRHIGFTELFMLYDGKFVKYNI